jgi:hypothetical protein
MGCRDRRLPKTPTAGSGKATPEQAKETKRWKNANTIALLTIRKNCSNDVRARIETIATAKEAFDELKSAYETKTTTEYHALLSSLSMIYDDRKQPSRNIYLNMRGPGICLPQSCQE